MSNDRRDPSEPASFLPGGSSWGNAELDRIFEQAIRCLEGMDLRGADDALKRLADEHQPTEGPDRLEKYVERKEKPEHE